MGKYLATLEPGLRLLIPILDKVRYVQSLKGNSFLYVDWSVEVAMEIPSQSAITADNVTLDIDGVLYIRVFDAYKARYVISRIVLIKLRGRRRRICRLTACADYHAFWNWTIVTGSRTKRTTKPQRKYHRGHQRCSTRLGIQLRDDFNRQGVKCLRYEIRDIHPPDNVLLL